MRRWWEQHGTWGRSVRVTERGLSGRQGKGRESAASALPRPGSTAPPGGNGKLHQVKMSISGLAERRVEASGCLEQ